MYISTMYVLSPVACAYLLHVLMVFVHQLYNRDFVCHFFCSHIVPDRNNHYEFTSVTLTSLSTTYFFIQIISTL
jgi:hypothetical protein